MGEGGTWEVEGVKGGQMGEWMREGLDCLQYDGKGENVGVREASGGGKDRKECVRLQ